LEPKESKLIGDTYPGILNVDSEMSRFWTPERAQAAVKASFFSRGVAVLGEPESLWLRFSEIKRAISAGQGSIGDRSLSRALMTLVEKRQLRRRAEGKYSLYNLVVPLADGAKAMGRAEGAAVESAGEIGGWGDPMTGWATLGIPPALPRRFRKRFQSECLRHQQALREILDGIWEETVDAFVSPTRGRVPRDKRTAGEKALRNLVGFQAAGVIGLAHSVRFWQIMERAIPGAAQSFQRAMQPGIGTETPLGQRLALFVATAGGKRVEELRPEIDRELSKWETRVTRAVARTDPLWGALTPKERTRAARRLDVATALTANLVSIVHT
jgi:hypothetical protein